MTSRMYTPALTPSLLLAFAAALPASALAQQKIHFSYLWHMEQPIYWPDQQLSGNDRYETAWASIQRKDAGALHPENNLREIFGVDDRRAAYQYRVKDTINAIRGFAEAGAQISYSGGLIENINSLGSANQLGYAANWADHFRTARNWFTAGTGGQVKPRLDIVIFPFHHGLMPLLDESTQRKQIQLYKAVYGSTWGASPAASQGFFPSEMAFSTRMIPVLASEGITWSIVSAEKISRACPDFPLVLGSGGINCDPPNKADQINPAGLNFYRQSISRGCSPAEAAPLSLTPHRAQYINPATGVASSIIVVPSSQSLSWKDGSAPLGLSDFNNLTPYNDPSRPMLILLAHDGDNFWGGGFSYYAEVTPNLVSSASAAGYVPTVVERYLNDHPVPANDVVHIEDGAWVNADGDFGAPQFINWNWPLLSSSGQIDVENGWHEDARNWAVITAAQNRVDTAEAITIAKSIGAGGTGGAPLNLQKILSPDASTKPAERAWHYFMGALNSGFMYYGTVIDMEVKPAVACNEAVQHADPVISAEGPGGDTVPPTMWALQRHPWNPGSMNYGPQYGYRQTYNNGDFWVWTFISDVSGIPNGNVVLKYRLDADGSNPLASTQNETYAGGPEVGAWQSLPMTRRAFPAGNVYNNPELNFFEMPQYIADQYHAKITGVRSALVDYYIEATDARGNIKRSAIEHVYVGDGTGAPGGGGGGSVVTLDPEQPMAGQAVTLTYDAAGRALANSSSVLLHLGFNNWDTIVSPDVVMTPTPAGGDAKWTATFTVPNTASQIDVVFNNGAGTWDSNGGQDWHFAVTDSQPAWSIDGQLDQGTQIIASNSGESLRLWAGLRGEELYLATSAASALNDRFILLATPAPGAMAPAPWGKAGQVAQWSAFIGNEVDSNWNGWFDAASGAGATVASGGNGGVLEGTINLRAENGGTMPTSVYAAVLSYPTANASSLISSLVVPAKAAGTNIAASEYVKIELCRFAPGGCCPADFTGDGFVDDADFVQFAAAYELFTVPPAQETCDLNDDTFVDDADFVIFAGAYEGFVCGE